MLQTRWGILYRQPFTTAEAYEQGWTHSALRHAVKVGDLYRVARGVYISGTEPASPMDRAIALLHVTGGVASGGLAGVLHGLDSVKLRGPLVTIAAASESRLARIRRADIPKQEIGTVNGVPCTDGTRTAIDLANQLKDLEWEQALESALRKQITSIDSIESRIDGMRGAARIRRVLALRPVGAPPTESLLETLMVQLIRLDPELPTPERQVVVNNKWGRFVARVDLAWPDNGIFIELDGQQHKDQPVYDARRETAVVAATGWRPARFSWHELNYIPRQTLWRLGEIHERCALATKST